MTAVELMRSRYQAYVDNDEHYLFDTWDPSTRPPSIDWNNQPKWIGLEVISHQYGDEDDETGEVHFKAYYIDDGKINYLEEQSRFVQIDQQWLYVNGEIIPSQAWIPKRNELCPCLSGKKFKRCCITKL